MMISFTRSRILRSASFAFLILTIQSLSALANSGQAKDLKQLYITLNFAGESLQNALQVIGNKSGLGITYNDEDIPVNIKINFSAAKISVANALERLFINTNLMYREYKGNIIIYKTTPKQTSIKGSVEGTLTDAETNEFLIGASVRILGTSLGSLTDVNGKFIIKEIPEGTYQVGISYLGYENVILRDIKVLANNNTIVDYKLTPSKTILQDIEIIGDKVLSGDVVETSEISLINSFKASPLIITGISAQQIGRSIDQDAGQVARRLPGVSILDNFVNIRGMNQRYNLTYLNGMVAPSSESDTRAFSYDLMPSGVIDKMTVYRSPAPELLADWAGGVIKIETKNTSIARQLEVNLSTWYRPGSSFENTLTHDGIKNNWLGMDDGSRELPAGFPGAGSIPANGYTGDISKIGERDESQFTSEQLAQNAYWGTQLYNKWNLKKKYHRLDSRAGINYYDSWKIRKLRISNLTAINTTQARQNINQDFIPTERGYTKEGTLQLGRYFKDSISITQARWGVVENLALHINNHHSLALKGIYNQLSTDETILRNGYNGILTDFGLGYQTKILYTYRSRSILATQLAGEHRFGKNSRNEIQWAAGYGFSTDNTPAQRLLFLAPTDTEDSLGTRYLYNAPLGISGHSAAQYYASAYERNYTLSIDYTNRFISGSFFKVGFFREFKKRDQGARMIGFGGLPSQDGDGNRFTEKNADQMYSPGNFSTDGSGSFIYDNPTLTGEFDVEATLVATYASLNIPLFDTRLNLYGGVRYEGQDLVLQVPASEFIFRQNTILTNRYLYYFLPSLNMSWNFTKKITARIAYGKTLNRPNYRELMPFIVNDPKLERQVVGDSSLIDAEIHNFDFRLELYPAEGEFITLGVYYKKLHNAIEPYINSFDNSERIYFANTPEAMVYGFEAEVRKSFSFLPWYWARKFTFIGNLAILKSQVQFQDGLFDLGFSDHRIFNRPLEGTASYVINAGLYYDYEEWGTKISVLYNVLGQRLITAPTAFFPAYYELPRHGLDITIRQKISKYLELRGGIQDVLNQPVRRYADYDRNERWSRDERSKWPYKDWMFQKFRPGSYYMLGLNLTF